MWNAYPADVLLTFDNLGEAFDLLRFGHGAGGVAAVAPNPKWRDDVRGYRTREVRWMTEQRVLTEDEAFRLLAHLIATAELHTIEPPHYAGRRIVEGTLPLLDALIRDGDAESRAWLQRFKQQLNDALAARRTDAATFDSFLHEAPGEITREIKRRHARSTATEGSDDVA